MAVASYDGYDPQRSALQRQRQLAEILQERVLGSQPKTLGSGIASLGEALLARQAMKKADKAESAYADNRKAMADALLSSAFPSAKVTTGEELSAAKPFDLTPAGVQSRNAAGTANDRLAEQVKAMAAMTGDPMAAMQYGQGVQRQQIEDARDLEKQNKPTLFSTTQGIVSVGPDNTANVIYGTEPKEDPPWVGAVKNAETGQWEFDPNYIKGYRQMHPGSASSNGNAPPSGYRWVSGANGQPALEKIPGGPADKQEVEYTPAQKDKYKKQAGALGSIQFAVDEYRDAVNKYGTRLMANPNDPDTAELEAAHTNLMMLLKSPEMFALGVLTGPDLEILEKSVTPPTGWKSMGSNAETIGRRLGVLDRFIAQQKGRIPEQFMPPAAPGRTPEQAAEVVRRNMPSFMQQYVPNAPAPVAPQTSPAAMGSADIDPELERVLDEALGADDDELPPGVTQEEWDNMDEQDRALFR